MHLNSNIDKIVLGIIFILGGVLYLLNLPVLSEFDEFCFTISAFFLSIATLFTEPLNSNSNRITIFTILKVSFYFLGVFCLILLPQFDTYKIIINAAESINPIAFLMFSLGIIFISMYFQDKDNKLLQKRLGQERQEAVLNERKKITEELYKRINKDEK